MLEAAERARGRHPQQRADAARPRPRRVLGGAPARARHALLAAVRPRGTRAHVALAGDPVRAPARRRGRGRGLPLRRADGRRSRRRRRGMADAVRPARGALRRHHRRLHAADAARAGPPAADGPLRALLGAAGGAAEDALQGPQAQALWAGVAAHAFRPFSAPMSSAIGVALGTAAHAYGWPVAEGGSSAISAAMISLLEEHGAKFETGVRVESLDELDGADIVMLDVAPAAAARIAGGRMPRRIARALTRYRHGPGAFKVDFAIEGGVPWTHEESRRAGTVHVGGELPRDRRRRGARRPRVDARPPVRARLPAVPRRSEPVERRRHPLYAYAHVPAGYAGDVRRRSRRRSSASRPASASASSPGTSAASRRWRPTTPTTSAATSSPAPTTPASSCSARAPRSTRTRRASRASTCARRRPRPAPAPTGCAGTTRRSRHCVGSSTAIVPRSRRPISTLARHLNEWRLASGRPDDSALDLPRPERQALDARSVPRIGGSGSTSRPPGVRSRKLPPLRPPALVHLTAGPRGPQRRRGSKTSGPLAGDHSEHLRPRLRRARARGTQNRRGPDPRSAGRGCTGLAPRDLSEAEDPSRGGRIRTADLLLPKR